MTVNIYVTAPELAAIVRGAEMKGMSLTQAIITKGGETPAPVESVQEVRPVPVEEMERQAAPDAGLFD